MNNQRDALADEAAAQAIQAEMWLAGNDHDGGNLDAPVARGAAPEGAGRWMFGRRRGLAHEQPPEENGAQPGGADMMGGEANGGGAEREAGEGGGERDARADAGAGGAENIHGEMEAIDGGVAGEVFEGSERKIKITRSHACPLVLNLKCEEPLDDLSPNNFLLKTGVTVSIGLDKNTKLDNVFQQYCNFVNSHATPKKRFFTPDVKPSDLEFVHCALLDSSHTAEASALMKNDCIKVRRERSKERNAAAEVIRQQRESDRKYFKDLRQLLPNLSHEGMGCDVILDCRGKVVDENGYSQNVLATTVRAHSVLLSKRCKWLGDKIDYAREDLRRRAQITIPSYTERSENSENQDDLDGHPDTAFVAVGSDEVNSSTAQTDDEDDVVPSYPNNAKSNDDDEERNQCHAAEVEDDEDEDDCLPSKPSLSPTSHLSSSVASTLIWVSLDHSPEAVKLLLEYCYTNRVLSLGQEAFVQASLYADPKDVGSLAAKESGPISPFRKHEWPNSGLPTISLHAALAGIALAEDAHMPRLSLMCEVAASQLVDHKTVIDVLSACHIQQQKTGNRLPLLRKAAMLDCVMANGSRGIDKLYGNLTFKTNLLERSSLVIPSLLEGTVEILPATRKLKDSQKKKEKMELETIAMFAQLDYNDNQCRAMERLKWRSATTVNRRVEIAFGPDDFDRKMPSNVIIRDPLHLGNSRGTKRKGRTGTAEGDGKKDWSSSPSARHIRRKRKEDSS